MPVDRLPRFSQNVAEQILRERGLEGQVTTEDLARAAKVHDHRSGGYASRDELELAASDLAKAQGLQPGMEKLDGLRFDRKVLDEAKLELRTHGVLVDDDDLVAVLKVIDEGFGRASKAEVGRAVKAMAATAQLVQLEELAAKGELPARPAFVAEAEGATVEHARRKLTDGYNYSGSGPVKVAFFDADSTLRVSRSGSVSANGPDDVALLPLVPAKMRQMEEEGYLVVVVSNQAGIQYGHVEMEDADDALQLTADLVRAGGGNVHYTDFAERNGDDRKPNLGMFNRLQDLLVETFGDEAVIDKDASLMIGDSSYKRSDRRPDGEPGTRFSNSDRRFAENAGVAFHEPGQFFGWQELGRRDFDNFDQRSMFLDRFGGGKLVKGGALLARLAHLED